MTIIQECIWRYILERFEAGSVALMLIGSDRIRVTDGSGASMTLTLNSMETSLMRTPGKCTRSATCHTIRPALENFRHHGKMLTDGQEMKSPCADQSKQGL